MSVLTSSDDLKTKQYLHEKSHNKKYDILFNIILEKYPKAKKLAKYRVLDVGSGLGKFARASSMFFRTYTCVDSNPTITSYAQNLTNKIYHNINFITDNIVSTCLLEKKYKYKIIISDHCVHFIPKSDIKKAFTNMFNLLKPNGLMIIIEHTIEPKGWGSDLLNKSSNLFDENIWAKKSSQLEFVHEFITKNYTHEYMETKTNRYYIMTNQ